MEPSETREVINTTEGLRNCLAIDFLYSENRLFYTEDRTNVIGRINRDGTDRRVVINTGLRKPQGLAVDWVAGNMYWTDSGTDLIEVKPYRCSHFFLVNLLRMQTIYLHLCTFLAK